MIRGIKSDSQSDVESRTRFDGDTLTADVNARVMSMSIVPDDVRDEGSHDD